MFVCLFRAYRIGQCRDVTVLRLISLGTVEEIIYLRQVYKQVPDNYIYGHVIYYQWGDAPKHHRSHIYYKSLYVISVYFTFLLSSNQSYT